MKKNILINSNIFEHQTGDIILTASEGFFSKLNLFFQNKKYNINSKFTHALLCYSNGVFVEATKNKKLSMFFHKDKSISSNKNSYIIIRNSILQNNPEKREELREKITYHLDKNYPIFLKFLNSSSIDINEMFCSQFVVECFSAIGIDILKDLPLNKGSSKTIMPSHLPLLLKKNSWKKVEYSIAHSSDKSIKEIEIHAINIIKANSEHLEFIKVSTGLSENLSKILKSSNKAYEKNNDLIYMFVKNIHSEFSIDFERQYIYVFNLRNRKTRSFLNWKDELESKKLNCEFEKLKIQLNESLKEKIKLAKKIEKLLNKVSSASQEDLKELIKYFKNNKNDLDSLINPKIEKYQKLLSKSDTILQDKHQDFFWWINFSCLLKNFLTNFDNEILSLQQENNV